MPYQVIVLPTADKAVARLPKNVRARIAERLVALSENPRPQGSVKLTGRLPIEFESEIIASSTRYRTID